MESLIDLKALSEVANKLIDKISEAIGWVVNRPTLKRTAKDTLIAEIQKSNLEPVSKAVLIIQANKIIREQANQEAVLAVALQNLRENAKSEKLDPDWLAQFGEKTKLVSDETFRYIWGKILAQECNEPNSIPKSLLHILEQMDKEDAECFTKLCEYSIEALDKDGNIIDRIPMLLRNDNNTGYKHGFSYDSLTNLDALGLISFTELGVSVYTASMNKFKYDEEEYELPNDVDMLEIGNITYTKAGAALCTAIDAEHHANFLKEDCIPFWNENLKRSKQMKALTKKA